jgi:hypothetical protein
MRFFSEHGSLGTLDGRNRLVGYLKVASAEADLLGDEALRRSIDGLIENIPCQAVEHPSPSEDSTNAETPASNTAADWKTVGADDRSSSVDCAPDEIMPDEIMSAEVVPARVHAPHDQPTEKQPEQLQNLGSAQQRGGTHRDEPHPIGAWLDDPYLQAE